MSGDDLACGLVVVLFGVTLESPSSAVLVSPRHHAAVDLAELIAQMFEEISLKGGLASCIRLMLSSSRSL